MIVYHGSTLIVDRPDIEHSLRPLDFGKAFYVTTVEEQTARWARRKAMLLRNSTLVINRYNLTENYNDLAVRTFSDDLTEWIDFVIQCRSGADVYRQYDVIIGKVANDKVFRVVDMYATGVWDKERALKEIRVFPNYDQIAFVSQRALERLLTFESATEVIKNG